EVRQRVALAIHAGQGETVLLKYALAQFQQGTRGVQRRVATWRSDSLIPDEFRKVDVGIAVRIGLLRREHYWKAIADRPGQARSDGRERFFPEVPFCCEARETPNRVQPLHSRRK